jgi:hypothetical protein
MTKRIAALSCCVLLIQCSLVAAEDNTEKHPAPVATAVVHAVPQVGPLRTALLSKDSHTWLRAETGHANSPIQSRGRNRGNWMERHPVWAGALVGFGTGVVLTYAVTHNKDHELLTVMSPGAGALIWGSVSAGVGALAGWGIARNRDDDDGRDADPAPAGAI